MLKGFADEHVPSAITAGLRLRGMDVVTVQDHGLESSDDAVLLEIASAQERLMLTCDVDFLIIDSQWQSEGREHAGICFWKHRNDDIGRAVRKISEYATNTSPADARNKLKYL